MENKQRIDIEVRKDGIYLILDNTLGARKPTRAEALKIIEDYGIMDIDFSAINDIFKQEGDILSGKISSNTNVHQTPEIVEVTVSKDRLSAQIVFRPPVNKGERAKLNDIRAALENANARYGILEDALQDLLLDREFDENYTIAKGRLPVEGQNGFIKMNFDTSIKSRKPKVQEDGKVNYQDLDLIETTTAGGLLATSVPAVPGVDGMDVTGKVLPAKKVKPTPALPKGKNTSLNKEGDRLVSDINGQVVYENNRISVLPVLDINGNVDNSTGNISFNGAVVIRGNVVSGFTITADGDIDVYGVVEGATLISKENITVKSGVQGQDKAFLSASGNITVRFAENCALEAGNDIYADSIMHSKVKCGGGLDLKGKKALLVGGSVTAGKNIHSSVIGSPMSTVTELEAGFKPEILTEFKSLQAEHISIKTEYDKLTTIVATLTAQNQKDPFPEEKKKIFLKTVRTKALLRAKLMSNQARIDELMPLLTKSNGVISASSVIRAGVKVTIGNAVMYVRDDIPSATLRNFDSKILIGAYAGDL